jgi:hypothetical protein
MVKDNIILDIHSYKELKEKLSSDLTVMERAKAFRYYRNPIRTKLTFIERKRFFGFIERYLTKERNIYQFLTDCRGFFLDIIKLAPKLYSELDQLIGFQLLNLGTLELKIEANPPEWVRLYDFVEEFYYDIEERRESTGTTIVINQEEEQEFYDSLQKLFQEVEKSEEFSS